LLVIAGDFWHKNFNGERWEEEKYSSSKIPLWFETSPFREWAIPPALIRRSGVVRRTEPDVD
jgi:hypothetical protein